MYRKITMTNIEIQDFTNLTSLLKNNFGQKLEDNQYLVKIMTNFKS